MPGANQLWMLAGFALFQRLRQRWDCLEVFPQAIAARLNAHSVHKKHQEGLLAQLNAVSRHTGWPERVSVDALRRIAYGSAHDRLDAYLASWVASLNENQREALGLPPDEAIWVPSLLDKGNPSRYVDGARD